jgi:hypothetical protein
VNYDEWGLAHINNVIEDENTIYGPGRYNMGIKEEVQSRK